MEQNKELNRLKVVLVEKKRTAKWLAQELGNMNVRKLPISKFYV